jgi:hypothetical protein
MTKITENAQKDDLNIKAMMNWKKKSKGQVL